MQRCLNYGMMWPYLSRNTAPVRVSIRLSSEVMASLHFPVHDYVLNMPFYLKSALNWMSRAARRSRSPVASLTNHGLVRLLIINALLQTSITWPQFIELPSNEQTEILTLQLANLEEIGPNQEAIEDQREDVEQENNQVEIAEPIKETKLA